MFPAAKWGDIMPPYTYIDAEGRTKAFPGYNWGTEGQTIWQLGCTPGLQRLTPFVECVEPGPRDGFLAHFGYDNPNREITVKFENVFDPLSANGLQPTEFAPGRVEDAFQVLSSGEDLTWHLTGNQATATADSTRCGGSITIMKILNPRSDPGRFNLEIDGEIAGDGASVRDGGDTGTVAVETGPHKVGESGATNTDLRTMTCKSRAPATRASSVRAAARR